MNERQLVIDPIEDLISSLDAFHIGTRWRVVAAPTISNGPETSSGDTVVEESQDEDTSSDDGDWVPGDTQVSMVGAGLMLTAVALPEFAENDEIFIRARELRKRIRELPKRISLSYPKPGCRPCWEPPIFDYSEFDDFLQANRTITAKEGSKDIAGRTEMLDVLLENTLLYVYRNWIKERLEEAEDASIKGESSFYTALVMQVHEDCQVTDNEFDGLEQKYGKRFFKNLSRKLMKEVNAIRITRGVKLISEWETDSSSSASQAGQQLRSQSPDRWLRPGWHSGTIDGNDGTTAAVLHTHLGDLGSSNVVA